MKITLLTKDKKFRLNYYKNEKQYNCLKAIQNNQFVNFKIRQKKNLILAKFINHSKSKMVNRCIITNRGRSVYKPFNISRHQLKKLGFNGDIPGIRKSSW